MVRPLTILPRTLAGLSQISQVVRASSSVPFHRPLALLPPTGARPRWNTTSAAAKDTHNQISASTDANPGAEVAGIEASGAGDAAIRAHDGEQGDASVDGDASGEGPKQKVLVLWDLDNKPPKGSATKTAHALRRFAERFGEVTEIAAYANKHAFINFRIKKLKLGRCRHRQQEEQVPESYFWGDEYLDGHGMIADWEMDIVPMEPEPGVLRCSVCGQKSKNENALRRHFEQLHVREQRKKLRHLASASSGTMKKAKLWASLGPSLEKYALAAHHIDNPEANAAAEIDGFNGLMGELERAGVAMTTVQDTPQAADGAIRRRIKRARKARNEPGPGQSPDAIDRLILVSDDKGFAGQLRLAREDGISVHVVGRGMKKCLAISEAMFTDWNMVKIREELS